MIITFIGNCQTVGLCFFLQELKSKNYFIQWLSFGNLMTGYLGEWSDKCKNKVLNYYCSIEEIKKSDVIIYQEIIKEKSSFSNEEFLKKNKKINCKLIKIIMWG